MLHSCESPRYLIPPGLLPQVPFYYKIPASLNMGSFDGRSKRVMLTFCFRNRVNGGEYGEVRQYGNFSFMRIYEAGHEVPFYQPEASLELFRRVLGNLDIATGQTTLTGTYNTTGQPNATHSEGYVPIPSVTPPVSYTAAITNPITTVVAESGVPASASGSGAMMSTTEDPQPIKNRFMARKVEDLLL